MHSVVALAFLGLLLFAATATGEEYAPGYGPNPQLPEPEHSLVPTVNIAPAKSWQIASKVRGRAARKAAFSFAKTCSMGLRSGLYGGRNRTVAPTSSMAA